MIKIVPFISVEEYGRAKEASDSNIRGAENMLFACRLTKARIQTHTLIIFRIYCFFTATVVTRTHLMVMLYLHELPCFDGFWDYFRDAVLIAEVRSIVLWQM